MNSYMISDMISDSDISVEIPANSVRDFRVVADPLRVSVSYGGRN